jgi:quercetin dioxygenase-like cupin family protein
MKRIAYALSGAAALALVLTAAAPARNSYPPLDVLLSGAETILGQTIAYPDGPPKMTAAIVAMLPGQSTGPHRHEVPLFAYMLEGELTVDYGSGGSRTYKAGDAFLEAFETTHNGTNTGTGVARVLAVFAGSETVPNTVAETP